MVCNDISIILTSFKSKYEGMIFGNILFIRPSSIKTEPTYFSPSLIIVASFIKVFIFPVFQVTCDFVNLRKRVG